MTERMEPDFLASYDNKTGEVKRSIHYPRDRTSVNDRKIFELYKSSVLYEHSDQPDKALECIVLACQYAHTIQSRGAYQVLVHQLIRFRQFDQLPRLVHLGQKLNADSALAVVAPILVKLGQVDQAIALVHGLNLDEHCADIKIIALAKVAVEIANQGNSQKAYQLIIQSLQMTQDVKHAKNKVLADIAVQAANAGFYEQALEIAQDVIPAIRRTATLAEIETISSRSQANNSLGAD